MPLSLVESLGAWGVDAPMLVGRWAVDLAMTRPRGTVSMLLLLRRFLSDVFSAPDDLMATTDGGIGSYVAEVTIALVVDVVDQMTVTAATLLRALCPGCSR